MSESSSLKSHDKKKQVSEHLKIADYLLKSGKYEEAQERVNQALIIEPGNFYALALMERIKNLLGDTRQASEKEAKEADTQSAAFTPATGQKKSFRERQLQELEAKQRVEEELRRRALEQETLKQLEEQELRKIKEREMQARKMALDEEEKRRREEEEIKIKLEAELKIKEEQQRKIDEERRKAEEEKRKQEELIARKKLDEEIRKRYEEEQRRKQEEIAINAAEEEGRREAITQKINEYLTNAKQLFIRHAFDDAMIEVMKTYVCEPNNIEAHQLETMIIEKRRELWKNEMEERKILPRSVFLNAYRNVLTQAWISGSLTDIDKAIINEAATAFQISPIEHQMVEREAQIEAYTELVKTAWQDGVLTKEKADRLEVYRTELGISAEEHIAIEHKIKLL